MDTKGQAQRSAPQIAWRDIIGGAIFFVLGIAYARGQADGTSNWPPALFVAFGGAMLLYGLVRSFGMRDRAE